jgi:hypothetical protein
MKDGQSRIDLLFGPNLKLNLINPDYFSRD